jgi:hypothetical protein
MAIGTGGGAPCGACRRHASGVGFSMFIDRAEIRLRIDITPIGNIPSLPDLVANGLPRLNVGAPVAWCDPPDEIVER